MKNIFVPTLLIAVSACALFPKKERGELSHEMKALEAELFSEVEKPALGAKGVPQPNISDEFRVEARGGDQFQMQIKNADSWQPLLEMPNEDVPTTRPLAWGPERQSLFLSDGRGRQSAALVRFDMPSRQPRILAENPRADLQEVFFRFSPTRPAAAAFEYDKKTWIFLDRRVETLFKKIQEFSPREISIVERDESDREWLVKFESENEGPAYCVFDTERQKCLRQVQTPLSDAQKSIRTDTTVIRGSDGLRLMTFVTQKMEPASPRPLLILIDHASGQRFSKNFNPLHRFFAELGFAVVSVNYRGSRGLGKSIAQEGKIQGANELSLDFKDVLNWIEREKIANTKKVALLAWGDGSVTGEKIYPRLKSILSCGSRIEKDKKKRSETLLEVSLLLNRCP